MSDRDDTSPRIPYQLFGPVKKPSVEDFLAEIAFSMMFGLYPRSATLPKLYAVAF
jgi:hypothetical protein